MSACSISPPGWRCSREEGHDGPCAARPTSATPSKPICSTCSDTHMMPFGEDRDDVMCTRCPVPCQQCRQGGNGPFCETTPCACACHAKHHQYEDRRASEACRGANTKPGGVAHCDSCSSQRTDYPVPTLRNEVWNAALAGVAQSNKTQAEYEAFHAFLVWASSQKTRKE